MDSNHLTTMNDFFPTFKAIVEYGLEHTTWKAVKRAAILCICIATVDVLSLQLMFFCSSFFSQNVFFSTSFIFLSPPAVVCDIIARLLYDTTNPARLPVRIAALIFGKFVLIGLSFFYATNENDAMIYVMLLMAYLIVGQLVILFLWYTTFYFILSKLKTHR